MRPGEANTKIQLDKGVANKEWTNIFQSSKLCTCQLMTQITFQFYYMFNPFHNQGSNVGEASSLRNHGCFGLNVQMLFRRLRGRYERIGSVWQ